MVVQEGKLTSSYIETQKEHFILMIQGIDNKFSRNVVFFGKDAVVYLFMKWGEHAKDFVFIFVAKRILGKIRGLLRVWEILCPSGPKDLNIYL